MTVERAEKGFELRVARAKETQRATLEGLSATNSATASATAGLKVAADAALSRNRARNPIATEPRNGRNSSPEKHPPELRPVAPPIGTSRDALEYGLRLLRRVRWTGRHVELDAAGQLVIRPRLGTADSFGREVGARGNDIVRALLDEAGGSP